VWIRGVLICPAVDAVRGSRAAAAAAGPDAERARRHLHHGFIASRPNVLSCSYFHAVLVVVPFQLGCFSLANTGRSG